MSNSVTNSTEQITLIKFFSDLFPRSVRFASNTEIFLGGIAMMKIICTCWKYTTTIKTLAALVRNGTYLAVLFLSTTTRSTRAAVILAITTELYFGLEKFTRWTFLVINPIDGLTLC